MDHSSYSFGQETVPLAPLIRRSLARTIDLALILSPLIIQFAWRVSHTDSGSLFFMMLGNDLDGLRNELNRFVPYLVWASVAWISIVISISRCGVSPGKWICGIRVIRATLRPCGLARALLRELMLTIDAPLFLTGIPAVISWLATDHRQRIGDLAADTIVVSLD